MEYLVKLLLFRLMTVANLLSFWAQAPFFFSFTTEFRWLISYVILFSFCSLVVLIISITIDSKSSRAHFVATLFGNFLFIVINLWHVCLSAQKLATINLRDQSNNLKEISLEAVVVLATIDSNTPLY